MCEYVSFAAELQTINEIITETRGDPVAMQNTLIQTVYKRGGAQKNCSITTGEDSKDKTRHTVSKKVSPVMLCTRQWVPLLSERVVTYRNTFNIGPASAARQQTPAVVHEASGCLRSIFTTSF